MSYKLQVGNKTYEVQEVQEQKEVFTLIDFLAFEFFKEKERKRQHQLFTELFKLSKPLITGAANYFMKNSQDSKELEAILIKDLWRLINRWRPKQKFVIQHSLGTPNCSSKFHYLMLRQLRNQSLNEVCRYQKPQNRKRYVNLNSSVSIVDLISILPSTTPNPLEKLESRDFISKLYCQVDVKTQKILQMVSENATLEEIRIATGHKATPAIKRRQEACRPLVIKLLYGSLTSFISNLFMKIKNDEERTIMGRYCNGEIVEEIGKNLNLHPSYVRKCVNKYRPIVCNMLR